MRIGLYTRKVSGKSKLKPACVAQERTSFSLTSQPLNGQGPVASLCGIQIQQVCHPLDHDKKKEGLQKAKQALGVLEFIQLGLLEHTETEGLLKSLRRMLETDTQGFEDTELQDIMVQLEIRIAILENQLK